MLLFNEQNQQIDVAALKARIANSIDQVPEADDDEIEAELGNYYQQAHTTDLMSYGIQAGPFRAIAGAASAISLPFIGHKLFRRIKAYVCDILTSTSVMDDIIDAVLKAVMALIPGAIIIEPIVAKIAKRIVSRGVTNFCAI